MSVKRCAFVLFGVGLCWGGRLLHVTRDGVVSAPLCWSGKPMGGVRFGAAFPFIADQQSVLNGFRTSRDVVLRFIGVPTRLRTRVPDLPSPIRPLNDRWILR